MELRQGTVSEIFVCIYAFFYSRRAEKRTNTNILILWADTYDQKYSAAHRYPADVAINLLKPNGYYTYRQV